MTSLTLAECGESHVTGGYTYIDRYGIVLDYEDVFTSFKRQADITNRSASDGHIGMENESATVGRVLGDFFAAH